MKFGKPSRVTIPIEDYHNNERISASWLSTEDSVGPEGFMLKHIERSWETPKGDPLLVGQAVEDAVFNRPAWWVVRPSHVKDDEGKLIPCKHGAFSKWKKKQGDAVILPETASHVLETGVKALRNNEEARELLQGDEQATWQRDVEGLPGIQARPDVWLPGGCERSLFAPVSVDLKTTSDFRGGGDWHRVIAKYRYHVQAAMVRLASGVEDSAHVLIFVEKPRPNRTAVVWLSERWIEIGTQIALEQLERLSNCYRSGNWSRSYATVSEPPAWIEREVSK